MFKGVIDSGPVAVEHLTALVGKNESGKTTLLKALHKLNPATPDPYSIDREWPRGRRRQRSKDQVVCSATFALDAVEIAELRSLADRSGEIATIEVTRDYAGRLEVIFANELFPDKLHPNEVDRHCEGLPMIQSGAGSEFTDAAVACRKEIIRLAHEGRFTELSTICSQQAESLARLISSNEHPAHQSELTFLADYGRAVGDLGPKLQTLQPIQKQAHDYVVRCLPKFIYMSDFRIFEGKAILHQVKERRDECRSEPNDETFSMLLRLSGLDLDDLVARGEGPDREQRQYDVDDGARTLTASFKERLKQREYSVEFRADGQEFYTMVNDQTDVGLIRLDERSKGFQWFFSFDMLFMHESGGTFKNCVLLLDEPGLHLHPGAQADLPRAV